MARTDTGRNLATFERDVLLVTGRAVRIRPAGAGRRRPVCGAFYDELSDTSTHYRFFGDAAVHPRRRAGCRHRAGRPASMSRSSPRPAMS